MGIGDTFDRWFGRGSHATAAVPALPPPAGDPAPTTSTDPDRPIEAEASDRFGRVAFAKVLARYAASVPSGQSVVFALTGAWGAGKTSVLNIVGHLLEADGVAVLRFNPWLFSGADQIATMFLRELSVQLGSKGRDLKDLGEKIEAYGTLIEAVPFVGGVGKGAGKIAAAHSGSVRDARARVEGLLRAKNRRVVVFVDDIDRLDASELRHVFKLVRLVADFPNVSYVLAFDRRRVEKALDEDDVSGREYLAKIVQSSFELPTLEPEVLRGHLTQELDRCLAGRIHGKFHPQDWANVLLGIIAPLIKTPRDVRRYVNAVAPAVDMMRDEIALEDLLALEAVRLFLPDLFDAIEETADLLTMGSDMGSAMRRQRLLDEDKQKVRALVARAPSQPRVARELCEQVFPASRFAFNNHTVGDHSARAWRRERKAAHREVLDVYLRRNVASLGLAASTIEELVAGFGSEDATRATLTGFDSAKLEAALIRLEDHVEQLAQTDFENGLVAVLGEADRLRRGRAGFLDFGADLAIGRLVHWILKNVADSTRRRDAMDSVLARTRSLSWRAYVLAGLVEAKGPGAIDQAALAGWNDKLRSDIASASTGQLAGERDLVRLFHWVAYDDKAKRYDTTIAKRLEEPQLMRTFLTSALGQEVRATIGSRVDTISWRMPWRAIVNLVGGEAPLRAMLAPAVEDWAPDDERSREARRLVEDLLAGRTSVPAGDEPNEPVEDE